MSLPAVSELLTANPLLAYPAVFAGGVLTSLTPCIYPMIPITAAVVGAADAGSSAPARPRGRVWALTLSYVFGLALSYAALGLVAGISGTLFGAVSTNRWLLLGMANLLLLFAAMMLDLIRVPVPSSWLSGATQRQSGGRLLGAFVMGAASGLVAAPCGAPVLATLLTWVAATQSAWRGFSYLFVFSLGMCSLLVVVGVASGTASRLPRAGQWMLYVKRFFAVVMLGAAEHYLLSAGQVWF